MEKNLTAETSLLPCYDDNYVAICLACSNEYTPFACITINSVVCNLPDDINCDIVVLNTDISETNEILIKSVSDGKKNVSVRFLNIQKYIGDKTFYTWAHFTKYTYYRLLIPDVFDNYKKVIYLDSDIIVNSDITELYNTDVNGYLFAAARDTHAVGRLQEGETNEQFDYFYNKIGVKDKKSYYQCGVTLYNIEEFNKTFEHGYLLNEAANCTYKWLDQDLMNVVARGRIKTLDNKWNVMVFNNRPRVDEYFLKGDIHREYFQARKNPCAVHFIGRSMPCYRPYIDFYYLFWKYARTTPYYENLIALMTDVKIANLKKDFSNSDKKASKIGLKNSIIMPIVNKIFPVGSKRRENLKKLLGKNK